MATFKVHESFLYAATAAADLTGKLKYFAVIDANAKINVNAVNTGKVAGVIFEEAVAGKPATIQFAGIAKVICAAAIVPGARVMSDGSGKATTGTTNPAGIALSRTTAGDQVVEVMLIN